MEEKQLADKVVHIGRVTKVVKGGRIFKFTALVVVGDYDGNVGIGHGKAREVPDAIRKAMDNAKKNMVKIPVVKGSIPHAMVGKFGASEIVMKPAAPGTGIIAGGAVRAVVELAGLKDIRTKCLRSNNPRNVVSAVIEGLAGLNSAGDVAERRGKSVQELLG